MDLQSVFIYILITVISIRLLVFVFRSLQPRVLAWGIAKFAHASNKAVSQIKADIFASMKELQKQNGDLVILEIGAGSGANFQFFPDNSKVIALEPNLHCIKYLQESSGKWPHVKVVDIIATSVEDLSAELKTGCVDAVVGTYVQCSVNDTAAAMQEIKRVLKPNGRYYFLEHVRDDRYNSWTHISQQLIYPFFRFFADCNCNKATWNFINRAGFRALNYRQVVGPKAFPFFVRPHMYGHATK